MTSSPLRQFFPALAGAVLLGLALYKMTSGTPAEQAVPHPAQETAAPVSYTHLDVYKRQAQTKSTWFSRATFTSSLIWAAWSAG